MMKCTRMLVVILICVGITLLGPCSGWAQQPEKLPAEPEEVAARFVEALVPYYEDEACYRLISEKDRTELLGAYVDSILRDLRLYYKRQPKSTAQIEESSDEQATFVVTTALPPVPVKLVRENGLWRVDLVKTWTATTGMTEETWRNLGKDFANSSSSNLQQLGLAAMMYCADHDGHLPPAGKWCDTLAPYAPTEMLFHCAAVRFDQYGYAFNKNLDGISREDIQFPAQTVMFFESTLGTRNATGTRESLPDPPRHPEGNIFGFADGHVQQIKFPETYVIWKP